MAAFGLNAAQVDRDRRQQERRAAQEQELEQRRAARDRESAEDRAREETLTRYLQQMSDLLTGSERGTADTLTLAQTLTFVALRRLDGVRKGLVVQFLAEAGLITPTPEDRKLRLFEGSVCGPVALRCRRAGVKRLYLENAHLRGAIIPRRLVREVSYTDIDVPVAGKGIGALPALWFDGADLRKADFRAVILPGVTFDGADLRGADFGGAFLSGTSFSAACLSGARFDHVEVRNGADFRYVEGRGVDFSNARLGTANFADATLTDVRLSGASTTGVRWPRRWTSTGLRMRDAEARARGVCRFGKR